MSRRLRKLLSHTTAATSGSSAAANTAVAAPKEMPHRTTGPEERDRARSAAARTSSRSK